MPEMLGEAVLALATDPTKFTLGIKQARKEAEGLDKSFSQVASSIQGALAAAGIGVSLHAIATATIEAERSQKLLETAVLATGGAAGFTAKQLILQSHALQNATTFSDEAIQAMQTRLLAFRNITGETFTRTQQVVLDFATRMGVDAASAAGTLGMALNNPVDALGRLQRAGVTVTDSLKKQVEWLVNAGQLGKAQALILGELEKSYKGSAAAARDTFGGALTALKNTFNDLFLEIHGNTLVSMKSLVEMMIKNLPTAAAILQASIAGLDAAFHNVGGRIGEFAALIVGIATLDLPLIKTAWDALKTSVDDSQLPLLAADAAFRAAKDSIAALDAAAASAAASTAGVTANISLATESITLTGSAAQIAASGLQNIGSTAGAMVASFDKAKISFHGLAMSFVQDIVAMIVKLLALLAVIQLLRLIPGGSAVIALLSLKGKAAGGPVSGGQPYLVGERGPELFVPQSSGTIVPNDQMAGAGGASITQNFNIAGMDFGSMEAARRLLGTMAATMRSGAVEALGFAAAANDQATLKTGRAYA